MTSQMMILMNLCTIEGMLGALVIYGALKILI